MIDHYVKCTDHNMYVNDQKFKFIYRSKTFTILGLGLALLAAIPFTVVDFADKKGAIHKIEIMNTVNKSKSNEWKKTECIASVTCTKTDTTITSSSKKSKVQRTETGEQKTI